MYYPVLRITYFISFQVSVSSLLSHIFKSRLFRRNPGTFRRNTPTRLCHGKRDVVVTLLQPKNWRPSPSYYNDLAGPGVGDVGDSGGPWSWWIQVEFFHVDFHYDFLWISYVLFFLMMSSAMLWFLAFWKSNKGVCFFPKDLFFLEVFTSTSIGWFPGGFSNTTFC